MKHLALTALLVAVVAGAVGFYSFRAGVDPALAAALEERDAMAWLRADFRLTDTQFAAVKKIHEGYAAICEEHCRAIQEAVRVRNRLKTGSEGTPGALTAAEQRLEELRQVCESALAGHVRRCAAEMSPEAGQRYLALVLPKIRDFDHAAAPDIRLDSSRAHQH